jgi:predicted Rossmann fold nucleotide-binding protein DprA/Smf involved in DNA uptake
MTESEIVKAVVEGLRSISQGVEAIAKKLEDSFTEEKPKAKPKAKPKKKPTGRKAKAKAQQKAVKKIVDKKITATDTVLAIVKRSKKGVSVDTIAEKTGYNKSKIYNILSTLKKLGKIKTISRGVYMKT